MSADGQASRQRPLRLGAHYFLPGQLLVMAIVNRTPDSFFQPGATWDELAAMERVDAVIAQGADIIDIGGVPARPGEDVDAAEEIRRVVPFVAAVRRAYPDVVISVDTWRHEVAREACAAGADLINDSWGGWDNGLAGVAAEYGTGLVCAHTGGQAPRTRPFRVAYDDVMLRRPGCGIRTATWICRSSPPSCAGPVLPRRRLRSVSARSSLTRLATGNGGAASCRR